MKNCIETKNSLRSGRQISDRDICEFVINLVMPLFAFAFNGEFKLKDITIIVHACSQTIEQTARRFKKSP